MKFFSNVKFLLHSRFTKFGGSIVSLISYQVFPQTIVRSLIQHVEFSPRVLFLFGAGYYLL